MYIVNYKGWEFRVHCTKLFNLLKVASSQADIVTNYNQSKKISVKDYRKAQAS